MTDETEKVLREEFEENPTYESMGKLAINRKKFEKTFEEPDTTNEISLRGKDLEIEEVAHLQRKPTTLEKAEEKISNYLTELEVEKHKRTPIFLTVAKEKLSDSAKRIDKEIKEYQKSEKEKRIKNLKQKEEDLALTLREKKVRLLKEKMNPVSAFSHTVIKIPRTRNIYSPDSGGAFGFGQESHENIPLAFRESKEVPAWLKSKEKKREWWY